MYAHFENGLILVWTMGGFWNPLVTPGPITPDTQQREEDPISRGVEHLL